MDEKKICFITCVNQEQYYRECLQYIQHLLVPEGYQTEILAVYDASSMAAGYNEAMKSSDAKYKVYLHQDVFLIYPNLIQELLDKFQNPHIGMIGVIGCEKLSESGIMWETERIGNLDTILLGERNHLLNQEEGKDNVVEAIDGAFMATQYDITWREDLFKSWDFYDVSQCREFQRAGYEVVVPYMSETWCIHDDGILNMANYNVNREIFIKEYVDKK